MVEDMQTTRLGTHGPIVSAVGLGSLALGRSGPFGASQDDEGIRTIHAAIDRGVTLEQRVSDVLAQLDYLRKQVWVGPILLAGVSEGADVASAVAAQSGSGVRALLLVAGAGMSQFFDSINSARAEVTSQAAVAQAFSDLDAFLLGKEPKTYEGYPSKRWRSFAIDTTNLDSLLRSEVPLFIVQGDKDESVPVASVDALVVEVMRKQPNRAIYYWNIVGAGHDLNQVIGDAAGKIYPRFVNWVLSDPQGRTYSNVNP